MVPLTISATGDSRPTMQTKETAICVLTLNGAHALSPCHHDNRPSGTRNLSTEYKQMSLLLPPSSSPLRETFEIESLVNWQSLPTFREALAGCRNFISREKKAKSVNALCLRMDGSVWLIKVGPKGGWKRLWNFSK